MKDFKSLSCFIFLFWGLLASSVVFANSIEALLKEAREKKAQGDLTGAAVLYQKILKLEEHQAARRELADVLIDAQIRDPGADHSEASLSITGS
jgi:hypothetical protein